MSKMTSSGVMFGGIGEAVGDLEGICSLGRGCGDSECVSGVGDFSEEMGEAMGVK